MVNALYTLLIYPLVLIVELCYRVFMAVVASEGVAILAVSVAITLLCLPLYAVAEKHQTAERETQKALSHWLTHIKKNFSGDERFLMTQYYYRENHYHPLMALRSSFGLLIQVPFFIAAYSFLSKCPELLGKSFLFIRDLGLPDALFSLEGFRVNVLPIAMTAINIAAGAIYSKGHGAREKVQIYAMAIVFLVILYQSPAGLVLYWTANNLFSLVKNVFYKLPNPLKAFWALCTVSLVAFTSYLLVKGFERVEAFVLATVVVASLPWLLKVAKKAFDKVLDAEASFAQFFICAFSLAIFVGVVVPSFLMTDSPAEYCYLEGGGNPLPFLANSALQSLGLFVVWPGCVYFLFGKKFKCALSFAFFLTLVLALIDNFAFPGDYGNVLPEIEFTEHKSLFPTPLFFALNSVAVMAAAGGVWALYHFHCKRVLQYILGVLSLCVVAMAVYNTAKVGAFFRTYSRPYPQISQTDRFIKLTKTGKNVIVIMVDGATGFMAPHVFDNRPALYEDFDGFVLYPNTVTLGPWTIQGALPLYGGYEYTPWAMNHRRDEPMVQKHNEGLAMQAKVFSEAGFSCTVMDPPYANYDEPPIFKGFEDLKNTTCHSAIGRYNDAWCAEHGVELINFRTIRIRRNFLLFGLFKSVPMILRPFVAYHDFWRPDKSTEGRDLKRFLDNYAILDYLPRLTEIVDSEVLASSKTGKVASGALIAGAAFENGEAGEESVAQNCFVIMDNEAKHDSVILQLPDFEPVAVVDNSAFDTKKKWFDIPEFYATTAVYIKLGEWFKFLKENGIWDNARIIITADHGSSTRDSAVFPESVTPYPYERLNPVLMVKDFASSGRLKSDYTFMTNADVPALSFDGVIKDAKNPFTGAAIKKLSAKEKKEKAIISLGRANGVLATKNNGYNIRDKDWWTVHDSIFDSNNWKPLNKSAE